MNAVVRFLFRLVWHLRLRGFRLVRVTGWRSCLYDDRYGQRVRATWMFSKGDNLKKHAKENDEDKEKRW